MTPIVFVSVALLVLGCVGLARVVAAGAASLRSGPAWIRTRARRIMSGDPPRYSAAAPPCASLTVLAGACADEVFEPERIVDALNRGGVRYVVEAPVCSLPHLRQMKRASERPRDAVDLAELDELHGRDPSR